MIFDQILSTFHKNIQFQYSKFSIRELIIALIILNHLIPHLINYHYYCVIHEHTLKIAKF